MVIKFSVEEAKRFIVQTIESHGNPFDQNNLSPEVVIENTPGLSCEMEFLSRFVERHAISKIEMIKLLRAFNRTLSLAEAKHLAESKWPSLNDQPPF